MNYRSSKIGFINDKDDLYGLKYDVRLSTGFINLRKSREDGFIGYNYDKNVENISKILERL
jgi:ABC-type amino acid transport substrate-binding protein